MLNKLKNMFAGTNTQVDDACVITSPMRGSVVALDAVPDATFAAGVLGQGVAIKPNEGRVVAPVDAEVTTIFPTGHAVALRTDDGIDVLIHVGINTVSMEGKGFIKHVENNQRVAAGDLLIEFDIDAIKQAGLSTVSPIVIPNANEFAHVTATDAAKVAYGEELLAVVR